MPRAISTPSDVDGLILGEGFGPSTIEAFLTALAADLRFRELPIGLVPELPRGFERGRLAGLEPVGGEPGAIIEHMLPLVRVHSFGTRLRRHIAALDSRGTIDAQTALYTVPAFARELARAIIGAKTRPDPDCRSRASCFRPARAGAFGSRRRG